MAKITSFIIMLLILQTAMFMFTWNECIGTDCQLSEYNVEQNSTVWDYFTNPAQQTQSAFWQLLFSGSTGILAILTAGGVIVAGAVWVTKDINIAYISVALLLVGAGIGTWIQLWNMVANSSFILGGQTGGVMVMLLVTIPLAQQLMGVIDWGRGKD